MDVLIYGKLLGRRRLALLPFAGNGGGRAIQGLALLAEYAEPDRADP